MKKQLVVVAVLGALISVLLGTLAAFGSPVDEHDQPFPEHPHVLVLGVEFDPTGEPISIRKCVDLAANQALPLNAHHVHVHFGTAGFKLETNASNVVVPTAPFPGVPWTDCESLLATLGL
jgi:hypothetical protein